MKQVKFLEEFKDFAMRGNVVDMAVGIIIGAAFGKIVSSLVGDILMPVLGLFTNNINFSNLQITLRPEVLNGAGEVTSPAVIMKYGIFIQNTIDFIIIAFAIFLIIRAMYKLRTKKAEVPTPPAPPSEEVQLLTQIRDLMEKK